MSSVPNLSESVAVGNHKCELIALVNSFQYGSKSLSAVVESGCNVGDDFSVGVLLLHEGDLPLEVAGLLVAGDPAVADGGAGSWICQGRSGRHICVVRFGF